MQPVSLHRRYFKRDTTREDWTAQVRMIDHVKI